MDVDDGCGDEAEDPVEAKWRAKRTKQVNDFVTRHLRARALCLRAIHPSQYQLVKRARSAAEVVERMRRLFGQDDIAKVTKFREAVARDFIKLAGETALQYATRLVSLSR